MGFSEIYCPLCGCPIIDSTHLTKYYKKSDISWLNDCFSLFSNNTISAKKITDGDEYFFDTTIYKYFSFEYNFKQVIEIHKRCYYLFEKEKDVQLKYSDFYCSIDKTYLCNNIDYGIDRKYLGIQEFNWIIDDYVKDEKLKITLEDPTKNIKSKKRILKIFNQFKIKPDRKGPSVSASLFEKHTYLIGNNNKLWKKVNNKWKEVEETLEESIILSMDENKLKKYVIPILEKYLFIGKSNMNGLSFNFFILKSKEENKCSVKINFIGTVEAFSKNQKDIDLIQKFSL